MASAAGDGTASTGDASAVALGARIVNRGAATRMVRLFLTTEFAGGRHERRVQKIMALEGPR